MFMSKKTIVILGVSSFVGSNLAEKFKDKYRVIGTYNQNRIRIPGVLTLPCDVLNSDSVQMILYTFKPDITIYVAGLSSVVNSDKSNLIADALNTSGVFNVTTFSERYKSKFVYISSSYVFGGENILFKEDDAPMPNTKYGSSKASAEFYIQKFCLDYLILRTCDLYGRSYSPVQMTFMEMMERKLSNNESFVCDGKIHNGFMDVHYLADILDLCFDRDIRNRLFQISSQDVMTKYDFSKLFAKTFHHSESLILKGPWSFPISDVSQSNYGNLEGNFYYRMDISNFQGSMQMTLPTVEESLLRTFKRLGGRSKDGLSRTKKQGGGITYI